MRKQRDELDKLINELTEDAPVKTNIPYASIYLNDYPPYTTSIDFSSIDAKELLHIRVFVNKKCNQISTDYAHTINLVNEIIEIIPYKSNSAFREIFIRKLLDQGRVQVSGLLRLDSPEMVNMYTRLMIQKEGSDNKLKGINAIYFGYLNLKEDLDGCWMWIASILNTKPNQYKDMFFGGDFDYLR